MITDRWRRGLLSLPVVYMVAWAGMLAVRETRDELEHLDAEAAEALAEMDAATQRGDADEARVAGDRCEAAMEELRGIRNLLFLMLGLLVRDGLSLSEPHG